MSKLDTSNDVSAEHPLNISLIFMAAPVSILDTSIDLAALSPLNIRAMFVIFDVSIPSKEMLSQLDKSLNIRFPVSVMRVTDAFDHQFRILSESSQP